MKIDFSPLAVLITVVIMVVTIYPGRSQSVRHRENGWYRIIDGEKDSIASLPVVTVKEIVITGTVSKHKLQAWADSTEQLIGKRIGFVYNDSVITAPRVNMRLENGTFQISTFQNYDIPSLCRNLLKERKILWTLYSKLMDVRKTHYFSID